MSHIDPSDAPRYRLAPDDGERLREILANLPPSTHTRPTESRTGVARPQRRRWLWVLFAVALLLVTAGLAIATLSPALEEAVRRVLSALGVNPDAVLARVTQLLADAAEFLRTLADAVVDMIDEILEQFSNNETDDQD